MLNCSSENKSVVIDRQEEIFHVHEIDHDPWKASGSRGLYRRRIISEDAVSNCVYPLALEKTGRRFVIPIIRTRSFGRYPARVVSCVRNRAFRYVRATQPILYQNSPLIFPYSIRTPSRPPRFGIISIIRNRLPVSTFALYVCAEARAGSSRSVQSPLKAYG